MVSNRAGVSKTTGPFLVQCVVAFATSFACESGHPIHKGDRLNASCEQTVETCEWQVPS
jgi:hypothetical protein